MILCNLGEKSAFCIWNTNSVLRTLARMPEGQILSSPSQLDQPGEAQFLNIRMTSFGQDEHFSAGFSHQDLMGIVVAEN